MELTTFHASQATQQLLPIVSGVGGFSTANFSAPATHRVLSEQEVAAQLYAGLQAVSLAPVSQGTAFGVRLHEVPQQCYPTQGKLSSSGGRQLTTALEHMSDGIAVKRHIRHLKPACTSALDASRA